MKEDYISRDQLLKALEAKQFCFLSTYATGRMFFALDKSIIEEQPTADVEEIRHGKWVWELQGIGKMNCKCTNCQEWFPANYEDLDDYGRPERETKRCPNCGAIMERSD